MKKEVFIEKAIAVHGDKFDYSLLPDEFKTKEKIPVLCKEHGVFYITTGNHLSNKRGCPTCGNINRSINNRKSLEQYKEIINNKFPNIVIDFGEYVDYLSTVKTHCDTHGWESKIFRDLLKNTYPCNQCATINRGIKRRKGLEEFLEKSEKAHGDAYDYSLVDFVSFSSPVKIICRLHGEFEQTPTVHIKGHGCKKCSNDYVGSLRRKELEKLPHIFFNDPNVTPDFDTYIKSGSVMKFTCKYHGDFYRKPSSKVKGKSLCQRCNIEYRANRYKSDTETFIDKAKLVFPSYDYSEVNYDGNSKYVKVTCDKGHYFSQRAGNLLSGYGCPDCSNTGFSYNKKGYLYLILLDQSYIKFGISNKPNDRFRTIKNLSKFECSVFKQYSFDNGRLAKDLEDLIKSLPIDIGVVDKIDLKSGYTETFKISDLDFVLEQIEMFISQQ